MNPMTDARARLDQSRDELLRAMDNYDYEFTEENKLKVIEAQETYHRFLEEYNALKASYTKHGKGNE